MISIKNLTQVYPSGKGIFDVNFDVKEGEVFGYLGPNGAGKTTTIRNILGFSNATEGLVTIDGKDARKDAAELQKTLGYLPGEIAFFDHMTGLGFLNFLCDMRGLKDQKKMFDLIERFELDASGKIKKMSKGMKQKVAIVAAFMHDPKVIILDEPTSGLDPLMQNKFMDLVAEEKKAGKTIIMSSHIFEEVDRVCDRVGIIKDGKIVTIEHIDDLKVLKRDSYKVQLRNAEDEAILTKAGLDVKKINDKTFIVTMTKDFNHLFDTLSKCSVIHFESKKQSLEDLFMKYYGKEA